VAAADVRDGAAMEQPRSPIPRVMGTLMIALALIGLAWTLVVMFQQELFKEVDGMDRAVARAGLIFSLLDLAIGAVHLVAGLRAISYKDRAPRLAVQYALARITAIVAWVGVTYGYLIPHVGASKVASQSLVDGSGVAITAVFYVIWPVIVLTVMTRPSVKSSCTNF
jgi:hypothetical protein